MTWKQFLLLSSQMLWCFSCISQPSVQEQYIDQYKAIAVQEMERAGIPASIKLAQGILESSSGQSVLATKANNHFGMKCGAQWKGKTYYKEDDDYDENGNLLKSCFRVFGNGNACYVAHSEFLRDPRKDYRYGWLFNLNPHDYQAWAYGLKKSGYATSPTYAEKLVRIIEEYDLHKFDYMAVEDLEGEPPLSEGEETTPGGWRKYNKRIFRSNDVRYVVATKDDTPYELSLRFDVGVKKILKYNEMIKRPNQFLGEGEKVFIQCKKNNYRGKRKYHYVKEGETMYALAQQYGVKLSKLYKKNRMPKDTEPAPGTRLKLRGCRVKHYNKAPMRDDYIPPKPPPENPRTNTDDVAFDPEVKPTNAEYDPVVTGRPYPENTNTNPGNNWDDEEDTPPDDSTASSDDQYTPPTETGSLTHIVEEGDTLYKISRLYDISVTELKTLNDLGDNIIKKGQKLFVR